MTENLPTKPAQPQMNPGIYFGLPDEEYHALPYLSATGIKNLLVSPMDFWARSHMNPFKEEDEQESEAKTLGKAYHKRILEGRAAFFDCYAPLFVCEDKNVLKGNKEMEKWLKANEVKGYSGKTKDELIAMVLLKDSEQLIYDVLEEDYKNAHKGKDFLDPKMIRKIELSAAMIEAHPSLKYYFIGGQPEVTVIWDDEQYGLRMKARFDYLKINAVNDLKTFANMMNKPIERAVYGEMASRKYHIQAALYLRAVERAKFHVGNGRFFSKNESLLKPDFHNWLAAFRDSDSHTFNFVFQQKGPAPVSVGAVFSSEDPMHANALSVIEQAVDLYKRNAEVFGTDGTPWVDMRDPILLDWQSYPAYANDL